MIYFQLPTTDTIGVPAGQLQVLAWFVHLSCAALLSYENDDGFEDNRRASWFWREGGDGCEDLLVISTNMCQGEDCKDDRRSWSMGDWLGWG